MTEKVNPEMIGPAHRFFRLEGSRWFSIFTVFGATFLSAITITNWARSLFDFQLLPYFEPGFDAILAWSHWVLDLVIFHWAEALGEIVLNDIAGALRSWFHIPIPNFDLWVPGWWKDASLVSFLLLRSQNASKRLSLPVSPLLMSDVEKKEWDSDRATVGRLGGALERLLWGLVVLVFRIVSQPVV